MLSEFALYWDMLSSIDLRINRKKPRSYTPYTLSTEHTESTRSKIICTMYFIFFDKQACKTQF